MNWYLKVVRQYADFTGRARRKEYWMFGLFHFLFTILAIILDNVLDLAFPGTIYGPLYCLYAIALFLPTLGVMVRRLHDLDKSGWMMLITLIPIIGSIWMLVLLASEGDSGSNEYGSDPKQMGDENPSFAA